MQLEKPIEKKEFLAQYWPNSSKLVRKVAFPLFWLEWHLKYLAYTLSHSGLVGVLEYLGKFAIVITAINWLIEAEDRSLERVTKISSAWNVINENTSNALPKGEVPANGSMGSIPSFVKSLISYMIKKGVYLDGIDFRGKLVEELDASNGRFYLSNFSGAIFDGSNFSNSYISKSKFIQPDFIEVNFTNATLSESDFTDAYLVEANFKNAYLGNVNFTNANFLDALLEGADVENANFTNAQSLECDQLKNTKNLEKAILPENLQTCSTHNKSSKKDAQTTRASS